MSWTDETNNDCFDGGNVIKNSKSRFSSTVSKKTYSLEEYNFLYSKYDTMIKQCVYSYFGTDVYSNVWKIKIKDKQTEGEDFFISVLIDYLIYSSLKNLGFKVSKDIKDMEYVFPYFCNLTFQLDELYKETLAINRSIKSADMVYVSRDIKDISGNYALQTPEEIAKDVEKLVEDISSAYNNGGVVGAAGGLKVDTLKPSMPPISILETSIKRFCLTTSMPEGIAYTFVNNGYTHGINLKIQIYEQDVFYTTFYNQLVDVMAYLKQIFNLDFKISKESRVDSIDKLLIKYQDTILMLNQLKFLSDRQKFEITKELLTANQGVKNSEKKKFVLQYDESLDKKEINNEKQYNTKNKRI